MATAPDNTQTSVAEHIQEKIGFARHVFDNYQALIRSVDTKAGALLGLALFFAASVFPISKEAVGRVSLGTAALGLVSTVFVLSNACFFLFFLSLISAVGRVIKPRGARFYKNVNEEAHLIWQEHIINYGDNASYFNAVSAATPNIILRNLTDQGFELANISKEKMGAINTGFIRLSWLALSWILNVILGLILVGWTK